MAKETLLLSEHYVSTQGEGPRTGELTQFVRFAGCNMRCPGWPCDTPYAIYPNLYRGDARTTGPNLLARNVVDVFDETGALNVCLTGGEPFLQPSRVLQTFVEGVRSRTGMIKFEAFTNGSFELPLWAIDVDMHFIMDWKLQGSGEASTAGYVRKENAIKRLREGDAIKFVVKDHDDLMEAVRVTQELENEGFQGEFWVGRVWDGTSITNDTLVGFISGSRLPWKLNVQVHKFIWEPTMRGV